MSRDLRLCAKAYTWDDLMRDDPCMKAMWWCKKQKRPSNLAYLWDICPRSDWMVWLLDRAARNSGRYLPYLITKPQTRAMLRQYANTPVTGYDRECAWSIYNSCVRYMAIGRTSEAVASMLAIFEMVETPQQRKKMANLLRSTIGNPFK